MNIAMIAAVSRNGVIGYKGTIPWHIKEDFQRFKRLTLGCPVIMGRKTYESLPTKPLPGRENIVLTRNPNFSTPGVVVKNSLEDALDYCATRKLVWIIGGQKVYEAGLPFADCLELTRVHQTVQGDAFFPSFSEQEWFLQKKEDHRGYSFERYVRKN